MPDRPEPSPTHRRATNPHGRKSHVQFLWIVLAITYIACLVLLGMATLRKGHTAMFWFGFIFPVLWIIGALMAPTAAAMELGEARRRGRRKVGAIESRAADRCRCTRKESRWAQSQWKRWARSTTWWSSGPAASRTARPRRLLVDLVERGIIRILDLAFIAKAEDGSVAGLEIADLGEQVEELKVFEGASSGLSDDDRRGGRNALEPGTSAACWCYENGWAAPFAAAVRRSGGQLVASGRIPVQAVLAALEAAEEAEGSHPPERSERSNSCQDYSRCRAHGGHRRNRDRCQQPRLPPSEVALGPAGSPAGRVRRAAAAGGPAGPRRRPGRTIEGARRAARQRRAHRGGVRRPEGEDPRLLSLGSSKAERPPLHTRESLVRNQPRPVVRSSCR